MDIYALLRERSSRLVLEREFSFARHTTIGCGGTASVAAYPSDREEACALLAFLSREKIPYCLLGAGANVLPADGPFDGAVVLFSRMDRVTCRGETLVAEGGATGGKLLRRAQERERGGLEFFTGIPMTVGGAAAMNAGVAEKHCADVMLSAVGIEKGKIRSFAREDCAYREKGSLFLDEKIAVVEVTFRAPRSARADIVRERGLYAARRKHLPSGRSMGCVFINPEGRSAGAIIDACGLKGVSVGGARVSERHANFILNEGATAAEIAQLIRIVKLRVFESTGILLSEEIRRIPDLST